MHPLPKTVVTAMQAEIDDGAIPSCAAAVIDRTGQVWASAVGLADLVAERKSSPQTVYRLYSGTKLYTATAVLQLVAVGQIALDTDASSILPDILRGCKVSIRQLLNHTSGLADTLSGFLAVHRWDEPAPSTAEALRRYKIRQKEAAGHRVAYSNVNYALLGEIISRLSSLSYSQYVVEHILQRLGTGAVFKLEAAMMKDCATGYIGSWDPMRFLVPLVLRDRRTQLFGQRFGGLVEVKQIGLDSEAVGGLVGSALDFLPFLHMQLIGVGEVLRAEHIREMQSLSARGAAGVMSREGMGLGWKIGSSDGVPFVNHEGGGPGFTSETRLYPAAGLGIVVMFNRWNLSRSCHVAAHRICKIIHRALKT